jgi:adenylate kinase family enzyme
MALPQIIILYGPPNAGKGTQSHFLKQLLTDRYHLDFGSELRNFVLNNVGDIKSEQEIVNPAAKKEDVEVALRLKRDMKASLPVQSDDLKYVIESAIISCVERGQGMIVEGPGRLVEEAKWLSGFMDSKKASVCIFHLYVSLEEVLKRSETRYYLPGVSQPFMSLTDATEYGKKDNLTPYRRAEDEDTEGTKQRYKMMYSDNFAKIISIYQLGAKCQVFTLDGHQAPELVSADIKEYFKRFCGVEI